MNYFDAMFAGLSSAFDRDYKFDLVLKKLNKKFEETKGKPFKKTFTKKNLAPFDEWLLQVAWYGKKETLWFKEDNFGLIRVCFDDGESFLLENLPESFLDTLIKNF